MKKNIHTNTQVLITISNLWHYFMHWLVFQAIIHRIWLNRDKFKVGDRVKYNWMAKYYIPSVYYDKGERGPFTVIDVKKWPNSGTASIDYEYGDGETSGSDAFWLKKA